MGKDTDLGRKIEKKETRKMRVREEKGRDVWFGLGMFGLVGWSVAIPTLVFLAAGVWIDKQWPSRYSWTLMLLVTGVIVGCWNAWYWVRRQGGSEEDGR